MNKTTTELQLQLLSCWQHRSAYQSMQLPCCACPITHTRTLSLLQDPSYVPGPDMVREAKTSQYFPDVAAAALEVLRDQVSTEELKRYMRKLHDHQVNPEQADLVTFELVYLLAERVCCSSFVSINSNLDKAVLTTSWLLSMLPSTLHA